MSLKNCPRCGKMYSAEGIRHHVCPECVKNENYDFQKIKMYLNKSPLANPLEVCEATGIPLANVMRFISSGALKQV